MIFNLEKSNQKQIRKHREGLIETNFKMSNQHGYRIPRRLSFDNCSDEDEDIPEVYDLHSQNNRQNKVNILNVKQLARINSERKVN